MPVRVPLRGYVYCVSLLFFLFAYSSGEDVDATVDGFEIELGAAFAETAGLRAVAP